MKTTKDLAEFILTYHKPELAQQEGSVWQIWEDGEITLQKSGELLWQRTLHSIKAGIFILPKEIMPVVEKKHGYAFIESETIGNIIREEMFQFTRQLV